MFIEGSIKNKEGVLIANARASVNQGGQTLLAAVTNGRYAINADEQATVIFKAPGYVQLNVPVMILAEMPDVTLTESKAIPWTYVMLVSGAVIWYYNKTKKVGKLNKDDILPIVLLIGGVLGFSVIKKILEGLGLWDSADTKDLDNASTNPLKWWNPNFWMSKPPDVSYTNPITESTARQFANTIYNSFGAFNDNEEQAINVFKMLPSQAAGSFLAYVFGNTYNMDLLTFLRGGSWPQDRLSDADVNLIDNYVSNLPKY